MKQVPTDGEINYRLLKAQVARGTLRRVDQNFKSFFKAHQDFQQQPDKFKGKPRPPPFKRQPQDNLVYSYQAFQVKGDVVRLEKGLEIKRLKPFVGQVIKQIEIIPKPHAFQAVFVYEAAPNPVHWCRPITR